MCVCKRGALQWQGLRPLGELTAACSAAAAMAGAAHWPISARLAAHRWSRALSPSPCSSQAGKQAAWQSAWESATHARTRRPPHLAAPTACLLGQQHRCWAAAQAPHTRHLPIHSPLQTQTGGSTHLDAQLAAEGKGGEGVGVDTRLIQVADVELHAAVVLGGDQLVGPGAAGGITG